MFRGGVRVVYIHVCTCMKYTEYTEYVVRAVVISFTLNQIR